MKVISQHNYGFLYRHFSGKCVDIYNHIFIYDSDDIFMQIKINNETPYSYEYDYVVLIATVYDYLSGNIFNYYNNLSARLKSITDQLNYFVTIDYNNSKG